MNTTKLQILVDADACPRVLKEIIYRFAQRVKIKTTFIANQFLTLPNSTYLFSLVVSKGFDEADNQIIELSNPMSLVITSDIPLADKVIEKGGNVLTFKGQLIDKFNIKPILANRDFMTEMREAGLIETRNKKTEQRETSQFTNNLNNIISKIAKKFKT